MVLEALPVEVEVTFYVCVRTMISRDPNRAANVGPEVVFLVCRLFGSAVLLGVEGVVAEILVSRAVKLLAAAPGLHDQLA